MLVHNSDNDDRNLAFNWTILEYKDEQLALKLEFEDPRVISAAQEPDILIITFLAEDFFFDIEGSEPIEKGTQIPVELPPQLADQQKTEVKIA